MFNDFKGYDSKGNSIHLTDPPTLLISAIGIVDDITKCVSLDAKFPGDLVYLLGENGSYNVNAQKANELYKNFYKAINSGLIASSISINIGGLSHAIKRTAEAGQFNIKITNDQYKQLSKEEYPSRILVTINPSNQDQFELLFSQQFILIGKVTEAR